MRIVLLRTLCLAAMALCITGGVLKGIYQHRQTSAKIEQQAAQAREKLAADQDAAYREQLDAKQLTIASQAATIERLQQIVSQAFGQKYRDQPVARMAVTATAYSARARECNAQPWVTASGTPSRVGVIAVSRDLEKAGVNLGDFVIIKGMGLFRVEDRMNKRWTKRIDILHANAEAARIFAKRNVEIMWLRDTKLARQREVAREPLG